MSKPYIFFLIIILFVVSAFSQKQTGTLNGTVIDFNSEKPLPNVLLKIEGTTISSHTAKDGSFNIPNIPVGKYSLICLKSNYYSSVSDPVEIRVKKISTITLKMLPGDPEKYLYFSIGGITVTAERDLIPETHETIHKISSGEIEHMQATNLGDILDLIPGIERKNQPGLQSQSHIALRGASTEGTTDTPDIFGTRVIVDDIPLSNNANLNTGDGVGYGTNVKSNAETGIDLRFLPADNVKEVEVIAGVPSVEYGDVTSGIVKVKTKSSADPLRLKAKNNPDTREVNFGGGFDLGKNTVMNFNINNAYSLRDLRLDGDEVYRLNLQSIFTHKLMGKKLLLKEKAGFTRFFEDYSVKEDPLATVAYNHDYKITYGQTATYKFNRKSSLYFRGFINYTRRKSYKRKLNVIDPSYVTDRRVNGTQKGVFRASSYSYRITTTGKEYNAGLKFNFRYRYIHHGIIHNLLAGSEYLYDGNKGEGKQFDPLFPISIKSGLRPRSFDEVPSFNQLSIYLEDRISRKIFVPITLTLGLRGEAYNPQGFGGENIVKSQNGTFWNPRAGIKLKLRNNLQIRGSYGISSKAPALASIYPDPVYVDVQEYGRGGLDTLITTYVYHLNNENLQGYTQKKFELSLDYKIKNVGLSLNGFQQETKNTPKSVHLPYVRRVYSWPNWPSPEGKILESEENLTLSDYHVVQNLGWVKRQGLELVLKTQRIPWLNMIFRISGSYTFKRYGSNPSLGVSSPRQITVVSGSDTTQHDLFPIYPPFSGWRKRLILNYNIDYINKPLGIWLTFTMYHKAYENYLYADYPESFRRATGYYENGKYYTLSPGQAESWGLKANFEPTDLLTFRYPSTFYFNLTVSKNIYEGMEISLFLNNVFNSRNYYTDKKDILHAANPEIFYGIEFSMRALPFAKFIAHHLF